MLIGARTAMWGGGNPYDYEVEYITLNGGWHLSIDENRSDQIVECSLTSSISSTNVLFGSSPWCGVQGGYWTTGNGKDVSISVDYDTFVNAKIDAGTFSINGETVKTISLTNNENNIFSFYENYQWKGKVASMKRARKSTGVITHILIPCVKDGAPAFFNQITQTFITHSSFTAGPRKYT